MSLDEMHFQLELAAFQQNLSLAKREVKMAEVRVTEIECDLANFQMDWLRQVAKAQDPVLQAQNVQA